MYRRKISMSEPTASDVVIDNLVWINPDRLGGVPCFYGTRVPIKNLFEYVSGAEGLEGILGSVSQRKA